MVFYFRGGEKTLLYAIFIWVHAWRYRSFFFRMPNRETERASIFARKFEPHPKKSRVGFNKKERGKVMSWTKKMNFSCSIPKLDEKQNVLHSPWRTYYLAFHFPHALLTICVSCQDLALDDVEMPRTTSCQFLQRWCERMMSITCPRRESSEIYSPRVLICWFRAPQMTKRNISESSCLTCVSELKEWGQNLAF